MAARTGALPRLVALAVCAASLGGIVWVARSGPSQPVAASADGDCVSRQRAEIEAEKAAGRLTAEQAMIRRQKLKAECG